MADYDDERPSWREIDKMRDKSRHVGDGKRQEKGKQISGDRWKEGRVKEALDRLFKGEKGTVEHDRIYNKIHKTYGTPSFLQNVVRYLEKYGLPDDVSTLILILDSKDADITLSTLDKIRDVFGVLGKREKEDVRRKISIISLSDKSKEVRLKAKEVLLDLQ